MRKLQNKYYVLTKMSTSYLLKCLRVLIIVSTRTYDNEYVVLTSPPLGGLISGISLNTKRVGLCHTGTAPPQGKRIVVLLQCSLLAIQETERVLRTE